MNAITWAKTTVLGWGGNVPSIPLVLNASYRFCFVFILCSLFCFCPGPGTLKIGRGRKNLEAKEWKNERKEEKRKKGKNKCWIPVILRYPPRTFLIPCPCPSPSNSQSWLLPCLSGLFLSAWSNRLTSCKLLLKITRANINSHKFTPQRRKNMKRKKMRKRKKRKKRKNKCWIPVILRYPPRTFFYLLPLPLPLPPPTVKADYAPV